MRKYGIEWADNTSPLRIEFFCIRKGGRWKALDGTICGAGLYEHYLNAWRLMWPEDDHHRWEELGLRRICENEINVFLGPGDSGKTFLISKFVMSDWWVDPMRSLWLVSSTDRRGAELRVWGKVKEFFNRAKARYPWLPGKVLESRGCITPDSISEDGETARLISRGIIFVPCKVGSTYVGLTPWVGIKPPPGGKLGHAGDECFVAGTMVDTPCGPKRIEDLKAGDAVLSATGRDRVKRVINRIARSLVTISLHNGVKITCTPEHKFFTLNGWVSACDFNESTYMLSHYEALCILRRSVPASFTQNVLSDLPCSEIQRQLQNLRETILQETKPSEELLFWGLCRQGTAERSGVPEEILHGGEGSEISGYQNGQAWRKRKGQQPFQSVYQELARANDRRGSAGSRTPDFRETKGGWPQAARARREWHGANQSRVAANEDVSGGSMESRGQNRKMEWQRIPCGLQSRSGISSLQISNRGGWRFTRDDGEEGEGSEERGFSSGSWVDSVEILKPGDSGFPVSSENSGGCGVYNLEIEGHPSYSVDGFLAHNCSMMPPSFLDAYANWYGKANFRGLLAGNPGDLEDPLCIASEPVDGWDSWKDNGKTQEWRSKFYNAWAVAFDGRDTPNNDLPYVDGNPQFPYLVGRKKMEAVKEQYGENDWHWWNQCVGKPQTSLQSRRVVTRAIMEQNGAFDDVIWASTDGLIKIASLDAAYGGIGGDRCVLATFEFGKEVSGHTVFSCNEFVIVPVSIKNQQPPEVQIALFVKQYCESRGILPSNFFFDGRSTLTKIFAEYWSTDVNVVDFGGPATDRPVSNDEYVWKGDQEGKRLKRCNEHYFNFMTELWFSTYYLAISKQLRNLPKDVAREGYQRTWKLTKGNRIQAEPKEEMKQRTTNSPDNYDCFVTGLEGARRLGFEIQSQRGARNRSGQNMGWLQKEVDSRRKFLQQSELRSV